MSGDYRVLLRFDLVAVISGASFRGPVLVQQRVKDPPPEYQSQHTAL